MSGYLRLVSKNYTLSLRTVGAAAVLALFDGRRGGGDTEGRS